ncbi:hypothetical protein B0H21DRAFT_781673 [Amylocystis lapponica]|nr:hypothetical protein B0H21DRAFT_781673 [Amylocystis lapponica]
MKEYITDLLQLYNEGIILKTPLFPQAFNGYTELSRLPYFDAARMTVIDPMYNILLGIVKTQWLDAWIHENAFRGCTSKVPRELDQIHEYLKTFDMPRWVARLPKDVGYPAGGSLTADEWKGMALNYCPAIPKPRMHAQDADNFLSLASALKIILAPLTGLSPWFSKDTSHHVKPNFHFVTHIFEQIEDYGPVYGFWMFLMERLNKVLKSYATNNHNGGELEVTFFRAFSREVRLRCLVSFLMLLT